METAAALICLYFRFYFPVDVRTTLKVKLENDYGMEMQEIFTESLDFTQYEVHIHTRNKYFCSIHLDIHRFTIYETFVLHWLKCLVSRLIQFFMRFDLALQFIIVAGMLWSRRPPGLHSQ